MKKKLALMVMRKRVYKNYHFKEKYFTELTYQDFHLLPTVLLLLLASQEWT